MTPSRSFTGIDDIPIDRLPCEKHRMTYRTASLGETTRGVLRQIWSLGQGA